MNDNEKIASLVGGAIALYLLLRKPPQASAPLVTGGAVEDLRYLNEPAGTGVSSGSGCECPGETTNGVATSFVCGCDEMPIGALGAFAASGY